VAQPRDGSRYSARNGFAIRLKKLARTTVRGEVAATVLKAAALPALVDRPASPVSTKNPACQERQTGVLVRS
ncbi:MAG: hypothetical protein ACKO3P_06615, partial [Planctomycetaceae bacterium]